ncbi:hypothetical protein UlMin_003560 [Ulmus minor]
MSILGQNKFSLSSQQPYHTCPLPTTTNPNPQLDRTVIQPQPKSEEIQPAKSNTHLDQNNMSLQSTWSHRAWLASGCTTVLISLAKCIICTTNLRIWLKPTIAALVGYFLADLLSGVYHWGIDNYGDSSTPFFGPQIDAFRRHHKRPWAITKLQIANILSSLTHVVTLFVLPIKLFCDDPIIYGIVSVCSGSIMFKLNPLFGWVEKRKVGKGTYFPVRHALHHRPPYNNNYCIVSGVWNKFLDKHKVFEALEMVLFLKLGLRPRSWSEPNSEWSEDTETPNTTSSQLTMHVQVSF